MKATLRVINRLKRHRIIEEYAIGGGIAAIFYAEPILTYDLDIFFTYKSGDSGMISLAPIYGYLRKKGYKEKREHIIIGGIAVQFIPVYDELSREAVENARRITYQGVRTRVLHVEHLIAIMIQVWRPKDRERIAILLEQARVDKRRLNAILKRYKLFDKYNSFKRLYGKQEK